MSVAATVTIKVTGHAVERAQQRFPWFDPNEIEAEVRSALSDLRISPDIPEGLRGHGDPYSLYAWTPDSKRVYALRHNDEAFYVTTTMRPGHWPEKGAA